MKRIFTAVLSLVLSIALFVGCAPEAPAAPKDYIYKLTEVKPSGESYDFLNGLAVSGDYIYMLTSTTELGENPATSSYLYKTDLSGEVKEKILLWSETEEQVETNGYTTFYSGVAVGKDGSVYLWRQKSGNFPDADGTPTPGMITDIVKMDGENQTVLIDVGEKLTSLGIDSSNIYVYGFSVDDNDVAYISINMDSVWAFDLVSGEVVLENKPIPSGSGFGYIRGFYKTIEGGGMSVVAFGSIEENGELVDKLILTPVNTAAGDYGASVSIEAPGGIQSNVAQGDSKYDYYGYGLASIYGYKDGVKTLVADLPASGVNLNQISRVIPVSETEFIITGTTPEAVVTDKLFKLTKVDPKDVPDRTIVTVAAVADELYLSGYITEFMLAHPEYQVEYKLYAEDSSTSFSDALEAFNTDIIAGNVPDVLLIDAQMPYGSYAKKGIFADLYPLIEKDPDVSLEDYHKPFIKALETDGKLYSIAPAFQLYTLVGKTSIFGEAKGQSLTELEAAAAKIPGATLFGNIDRDYFVDGVFRRMARRFIDDEKGICSFTSPEFISLLEYAKSLHAPAPDAEPYMNYSWEPDETNDYRENRVLIEHVDVKDFRDIVSMEQVDFGEAVTYLGFPNASGGSGITARARMETAVMAKSKNPAGAWEFVKGLQYYGDPFIESIGYPPLWFFPLVVSELDIAAKNSTAPAFQYDFVTGEKIPRANWLSPNLTEIQPDNTEADNAKIYDLIESVDGIERSVPAINDIINEETTAFLQGSRTAEETAEIIQNRATTYLQEMG